MINEKMRMLGAQRSEIRELFEYGKKRKAEIGADKVFDFSLGNPSVACPDEVNLELARLLSSSDPVKLHGYTSAQGDAAVRAAIAEHIRLTEGFDASADDIYMTVGAAAALTCSLTALVSEGEEVIVLAPYFPEYKVFIERCGGVVREVKCKAPGFEPDTDAIADAINERTAAVIINSPNNPTGAVYSEKVIKELSAVLTAAEKRYGKSIYLISDEPYRELVYGDVSVPYIPKLYDNTVLSYSYSKSLSLPGERIGYCLVSKRAKNSTAVYQAICGAGRALGFVCAPSMLQKMLPKCLGMTSDIQVYDTNRQLLLSKLGELGYEMVEPQGAFYLFIKSPMEDSRAFSEVAKKHELLIVPSDSFGCSGYVRIAYCVSTEEIERALPAFEKLSSELGLTRRGKNEGSTQ